MTTAPKSNHEVLNASRAKRGLAETVLWFAALALLWTLLNPGDRKSWLVGLPVVTLATVVAVKLHSPMAGRVSLQGAVRFLFFFAWQSCRGGWDVAKRAFHPRLPLNPALVKYPMCLPEGPERILFLNITSLLPGTVSVGLEGDTLLLHVLDAGPDVAREMQMLEAQVADLFALGPVAEGRRP